MVREPQGTPAEPVHELVAAIRDGLAELADPVRAEATRAYMKSVMPYRGLITAARRGLVRAAQAATPPLDAGAWLATILALWREAAYREERYAAIDLLIDRQAAAWRTPALVPTIEELVVTGAWWDLVDPVATHALGDLLGRFHGEVRPVVAAWAGDEQMWLRRSAVICQIKAKSATDTALLERCIEANIGQRDFFIRKAIGWALREYAKTDPDWVAGFVGGRADRLSPLSRREALKHIGVPASQPLPRQESS
jgi:3-methyladenine DNA glycosylase AlkD